MTEKTPKESKLSPAIAAAVMFVGKNKRKSVDAPPPPAHTARAIGEPRPTPMGTSNSHHTW